MGRAARILLCAFCCALLFGACSQDRTTTGNYSEVSTVKEAGSENVKSPQTSEETEESSETENVGGNTAEDAGNAPETPIAEEPPSPEDGDPVENGESGSENGEEEENTCTVRFYAPDGTLLKTMTLKPGETLSTDDLPSDQAQTGYRYVWTLPNEPLTADTDCYAVLYEEIATATGFLAISYDKNYILTQNIDFSSVDTSEYPVDGETGGLISDFGGILDGNGYALSGLTFKGTQAKCLFGNLSGATLKDLDFGEVIFDGQKTALGGNKTYGCALFGKITDGATLQRCKMKIVYRATGTPEDMKKSNAGLVRSLQSGTFVGCELTLVTPNNSSATDGVYAVCVWKHTSVSVDGIAITPENAFSTYFLSSEA